MCEIVKIQKKRVIFKPLDNLKHLEEKYLKFKNNVGKTRRPQPYTKDCRHLRKAGS